MIPQTIRDKFREFQGQFPILREWRLVESSRSSRRLGGAIWRNRRGLSIKEIRLASWVWSVNGADHPQVMDTFLHEVAHVLAGVAAGHGPLWKATCRALGATPERLVNLEAAHLSSYAFRAVCGVCGHTYHAQRRSHGRMCGCIRKIPRSEWTTEEMQRRVLSYSHSKVIISREVSNGVKV